MRWDDKVRGASGRVWEKAELQYDPETRVVITTMITARD